MAQQTCNQFEPTTNTSSATICKWCGQEKFLHALKVDYMAQQTVMQELIDELRKTRDDGEHEYRTAYNLAIAIANEFLEKEKEQIINAWIDGGGYPHLSEENDRILAEQYYNETYNK